jgi:hypothetical protein
MQLHGVDVAFGERQACAGAAGGADSAQQIGAGVALIGGQSGTCAAFGPDAGPAVFLADAGFVLEPDFDRAARWSFFRQSVQLRSEVFLNASISSASCAGCRGRAEIRT